MRVQIDDACVPLGEILRYVGLCMDGCIGYRTQLPSAIDPRGEPCAVVDLPSIQRAIVPVLLVLLLPTHLFLHLNLDSAFHRLLDLLQRSKYRPATRNSGRGCRSSRSSKQQSSTSSMDLKFPATQPDQMLCYENKRRIINEKHSAWMAQRDRALAGGREEQQAEPAAPPTLRGTLDDVHMETMAAMTRYDTEKKQLSKLPPARRRAAMAEKRTTWMEQRRVGEEAPISAETPPPPQQQQPPQQQRRRKEQPPTSTAAAVAADSVMGQGNSMLAQLHAERQARAAGVPPASSSAAAASRAPQQVHAALSDLMLMSRQAGTTAAHSMSLSAQATQPQGWTCGACTFAHSTYATACEMCGTPHEGSRPQSQAAAAEPSPQQPRRASPFHALDAELGLDDEDEDGGGLGEIEDFLAAVELDLQQED